MTDPLIDWGLRGVMALVSVFVFLLGRDVKRTDEVLALKLTGVLDTLRLEILQAERRATHSAIDQIGVTFGTRHTDILTRLERAGQRSSDVADLVQALEIRIVRLETQRVDDQRGSP